MDGRNVEASVGRFEMISKDVLWRAQRDGESERKEQKEDREALHC